RPAVPLQVENQLPFRQQVAAPTVRDRPELVRFRIGAPASAFADPVIETLLRDTSTCAGKRYEEGVCFEVVQEVKGPAPRIFGPLDEWSRRGIGKVSEHTRPPRRKQIDGRTRIEAGLKPDVPAENQITF